MTQAAIMAKADFPGIERWMDRHGTWRHYYRPIRGGARTKIPGDFGSEEFMAAYHAAIGKAIPKPTGKAAPGTMAALAASYYASPAYADMRLVSRKTRRRVIERFLANYGARQVASIERHHVIAILDKLADRPGASIDLRKALKALFARAIDLQWRKDDPTIKIKRRKTGHWRAWSDDEIAQMEAHWPVGSKERLAFALHLYTGQRRSDVVLMTRKDVSGNVIRIFQQKTGNKAVVPIHKDLRAILDASPMGAMYLLETEYGRPFSAAGYGNWMRFTLRAAGLPGECVTHGLRKATGRLLVEAGCSTKQVMAILGLRALEVAELYTADADQEILAAAGMAHWEGNS